MSSGTTTGRRRRTILPPEASTTAPPEESDRSETGHRVEEQTAKTELRLPVDPLSESNDAEVAPTKRGGVAPYVRPPGRFSRFAKRSGWRRQGFVPLGPAREKRRHRVLPRTVIGISTMLTSAGVGAGVAGAAFYAYYDDRLARNEEQVATFVSSFDEQFDSAAGSLERLRDDSVEQIRSELVPLESYVTDANGVVTLPETAGPSVWALSTTDDAGRTISGAAFAVVGHRGGTALVTSYSLVAAATVEPAPSIRLTKGDRTIDATLLSWDVDRDLALIATDETIPTLPLARTAASSSIGRSLFAVSGVGGRGATATPGLLLDVSPDGVQHTVTSGPVFVGGPLVDAEGTVIGMVSGRYEIDGLDFGDIAIAPGSEQFCERILRCADTGETVAVPAAD